ncbi:MAG: hypothetical protein ACRDF8_05410, partial [Chloroflexota bacterium]
MFYSALHRINTHLIQERRRATSHDVRERLLTQELPEIVRYYLELKQRSERARDWPDVTVTASDLESLLASEYQAILDGVT